MRQLSMFTLAELAGMRDRTASRNYSPDRDEFRREHERHRAWGLARRHAERLRRLRRIPQDPPTANTTEESPQDRTRDPSPSPSPASEPTPCQQATRPAPGGNHPTGQDPSRGHPTPGPQPEPAGPRGESITPHRTTGCDCLHHTLAGDITSVSGVIPTGRRRQCRSASVSMPTQLSPRSHETETRHHPHRLLSGRYGSRPGTRWCPTGPGSRLPLLHPSPTPPAATSTSPSPSQLNDHPVLEEAQRPIRQPVARPPPAARQTARRQRLRRYVRSGNRSGASRPRPTRRHGDNGYGSYRELRKPIQPSQARAGRMRLPPRSTKLSNSATVAAKSGPTPRNQRADRAQAHRVLDPA